MSKKPVKLRITKAVFVSIAVGGLVGLMVAALFMYVAWDHNPQLEYHEPGTIHWGQWLSLGILWFAIVGGGLSLVLSIALVLYIGLSRRTHDPTSEDV